jgi:uncharacterized membrane protein YeiH
MVTYLLDLLGVGVFALSGALAGIHRGLDLFGIAVLAMVTGIGGGTLRDVLLHRYPILWVRDPKYLYMILAATLIAVLGQRILPNLETAFLIADAMGLGLFALSGARRNVYATAAIAGICLYLILQRLGVNRTVAFFIGIASVIAIRLVALAFHWQLPTFA